MTHHKDALDGDAFNGSRVYSSSDSSQSQPAGEGRNNATEHCDRLAKDRLAINSWTQGRGRPREMSWGDVLTFVDSLLRRPVEDVAREVN